MAVFLSLTGVFGLVVYECEYRRKEIAFRKVLGSTSREIIILFNKTYIRILTVCFLLAVPVASYGTYRWLENFAYKTPMYYWVYGISFFFILTITSLTVTFQSWRAANSNPIKSLKSE
jgi:putative ABC transport system permease protein